MLYIVEVAIDAENLAHEFSQMRTWLDHMKFQAIGFRQMPSANIYRVHFAGEQEARAFADAFGGQLLNRAVMQDSSFNFNARRAMDAGWGGKSASRPSTNDVGLRRSQTAS